MKNCNSKLLPNFFLRITFFFILLFLSSGCLNAPPPVQNNTSSPYNTPLTLGNKKIFVEVVSNNSDMEKGLSGRRQLSDTEGMLFDFKSFGRPIFWMKDMSFNLDIIWIANKKIVGITHDVPAPNNSFEHLPTYSPPTDVDMVLEVNAGWSKKNIIIIGDEISF